MSGPHDPNKKQVTFWATEEEKSLLQSAFQKAGFNNLADYLRWIAKTQPAPGKLPPDAITAAQTKTRPAKKD